MTTAANPIKGKIDFGPQPWADMPDTRQYVCLHGNLSDGFIVTGPYPTFDSAAELNPGPDVWIMELSPSVDLP